MAFSYKKSITIDHTKVPNTDQSNFPLLVSVTDVNLKTVANGGHVTSNSGYDICFYAASDLSGTKLSHEIISYSPTTGKIEMFVKLASVTTASDTIFYMGYGDSGVTTSQESIADVWSNGFLAVYHLNSLNDSLGGTAMTAYNTPTSGVDAKIGKGYQFASASSQYLMRTGSVISSASPVTISGWFYPTSTGGLNGSTIASVSEISTDTNIIGIDTYNGKTDAYIKAGGTWGEAISSNAGSVNNWIYLTGIFTSSTSRKGYLNDGVTQEGANTTNLTPSGMDRTSIGRISRPVPLGYANGIINEVRFSSVARSEDWIATEYNNQSSPSTFMSFGSEETITPASAIKNINGLAIASVKNVNGLAMASVKNINGLA